MAVQGMSLAPPVAFTIAVVCGGECGRHGRRRTDTVAISASPLGVERPEEAQ